MRIWAPILSFSGDCGLVGLVIFFLNVRLEKNNVGLVFEFFSQRLEFVM